MLKNDNVPCLFLDRYFNSISECKRFHMNIGIPFNRCAIIDFKDADSSEVKNILVVRIDSEEHLNIEKKFNSLYGKYSLPVVFSHTIDELDRSKLDDIIIYSSFKIDNCLDAYMGILKGEKWRWKTKSWNNINGWGKSTKWRKED